MKDSKIRLFEIMGKVNPDFNVNKKEEEIIQDILSPTEGVSDWFNKFINYGKKGLLTAGIVLSIAFSSQAANDNKTEQVLNYGIEHLSQQEKMDIANFFIGFTSEMITQTMRNGDYETAKALKEISMYYDKLKKTGKRDSTLLSDKAHQIINIVNKRIKDNKITLEDINYYISLGKNIKHLYNNPNRF